MSVPGRVTPSRFEFLLQVAAISPVLTTVSPLWSA